MNSTEIGRVALQEEEDRRQERAAVAERETAAAVSETGTDAIVGISIDFGIDPRPPSSAMPRCLSTETFHGQNAMQCKRSCGSRSIQFNSIQFNENQFNGMYVCSRFLVKSRCCVFL
jgi:hypothetical protein